MGDTDTRSGRDTRLLALVIVIALAVLFVLARFRFPDADQRPAPVATNPLERLAARASFDDLATTVTSVLSRVTPSVAMLDLEPVDGQPLASGPARAVGVRLNGGGIAASLPSGVRVVAGDPPADVVQDPARGLTIVRSGTTVDVHVAPAPVAGVGGFSYLAIVEASLGGPTVSPAFVGRLDSVEDPEWGGAVLVAGGSSGLPIGALIFTLEGRFVGLVVPHLRHGRAIAPLSALERAAAGRQEGGGGRP